MDGDEPIEFSNYDYRSCQPEESVPVPSYNENDDGNNKDQDEEGPKDVLKEENENRKDDGSTTKAHRQPQLAYQRSFGDSGGAPISRR